MKTRTIDVSLHLGRESPTLAVATVAEWSLLERLWRGFSGALLLWAIALAAVIVPLLHFVLVPGFLLAGLVVGGLRFWTQHSLVALEGPCPRCRKPGAFAASGRYRTERSVACNGCGNLLELKAAAPSA